MHTHLLGTMILVFQLQLIITASAVPSLGTTGPFSPHVSDSLDTGLNTPELGSPPAIGPAQQRGLSSLLIHFYFGFPCFP